MMTKSGEKYKGFPAENLKNFGQTFHDAPTFPLLLYQTPFIMGFIMGKLKLVPVVSSTVSYERGLFQAVTLFFDSRLNGCL